MISSEGSALLSDFSEAMFAAGGDTEQMGEVMAEYVRRGVDLLRDQLPEFLAIGRDLIGGRRYRFVSPGWTLSPDGTPLALCSVGLTNRPNLPVKPVVNAGEAGGRDPEGPTNENKGKQEMDLKKIADALGLPETATENEIIAAIVAMKKAQDDAAEAAADAKAEAFAENAVKSGKIAANSKDAVKKAYRSNPEVAQQMLNSLAAPAAPKAPDFNAAKTPTALNAAKPGSDAEPLAVYNAYVAMADGAEKEAYLAANAAKIEEGYAKSLTK